MRFKGGKRIAELRSLEIFKACTDAELRLIEGLGTEIAVPAGTRLLKEGSAGLQAMIVVEGTIGVQRDGEPLAELGAGTVLGEMSLLEGTLRSASAVTLEPARLLILDAGEFAELLRQAPNARAAITRTASDRARPQPAPRLATSS